MQREQLAHEAVTALLAGQSLTVRHPPGWTRPVNWPLPIKRQAPASDGSVSQAYRPIALLEYLGETASGLPDLPPLPGAGGA